MTNSSESPPYFDALFQRLEQNDPATVHAFGRHVHWGYWEAPPKANVTPEQFGEAAERLCAEVCRFANVELAANLLDVGCGFGGTIARLNELHSNLSMVGVNIDQRQLDRAQQTIQSKNGNSISFVHADAANLPIQDASVDIVLAVECIFHFNRPRFLSEAARVLSPGGQLVISDFVPSERAVEFLDSVDYSTDESMRWSYGTIDLTCSMERYAEFARQFGLKIDAHNDITTKTLPTYDFLLALTDDWENQEEANLFRRATRTIMKSNRSGLIAYQVIRFIKE